jgi:hypothetical protein
LQALGTVFAFCDCVISLLPRILPYSGFTFDAPDHQSSYIYSRCLSRYSFRVSRLHKSLFYRHFAVYRNHFRSARTSVLYIFYYTVPVTVLQIRRSYLSRPRATTLHTPSQYISSSTIYTLQEYFPVNRHSAVYWIHFRSARTSVLYIITIYRTRVSCCVPAPLQIQFSRVTIA